MSTYKISYSLKRHENGVPEQWLRDRLLGGCQQIVIATVAESGIKFLSMDGATGENVSPNVMLAVWATLTHGLAGDLNPEAGAILAHALDSLKELVRRSEAA